MVLFLPGRTDAKHFLGWHVLSLFPKHFVSNERIIFKDDTLNSSHCALQVTTRLWLLDGISVGLSSMPCGRLSCFWLSYFARTRLSLACPRSLGRSTDAQSVENTGGWKTCQEIQPSWSPRASVNLVKKNSNKQRTLVNHWSVGRHPWLWRHQVDIC